MPYLYVRVSLPESPVLADRIVSILMQRTNGLLGKKSDVISIALDFVSPESWFVGGSRISEQQAVTFYLNIKVTAGTNNKSDKARYIQAVFTDFEAIFGSITPASYIVIDEIAADSWGFQGVTQEQRFMEARA